MRLCDLTGEYEPHSAATGFCRIKGREDIRRIHKTWAIVFNEQIYICFGDIPSHPDFSIGI